MTLNEKQTEFTNCIARLISWAFDNDIKVILAEAYRTKEQAEIYALSGKGIRNSAHCYKLAVDLFVFTGSTVSWDSDDYEDLGKKWKTMHPLARWGGDFNNRDCVHFSFEHKGRK